MAEKKSKTTKKAAPKTKAETAPETKVAKAPREKAPKEDLMTFAFRMPKTESAALHKAAGPGRGSRVMRSLAGAFVTGDRAVFESIVKEARDSRQ
jgi:hypothetical protein